MPVREAVESPRVHLEDGVLFAEPGIDLQGVDTDAQIVRFSALNLFFGGVQAAMRSGADVTGAGDPRRGGVAVSE
jgi:gamma-glutamyltranspeptidase/glutathione hydrolase